MFFLTRFCLISIGPADPGRHFLASFSHLGFGSVFWLHFGTILGPFWHNFGPSFDTSRQDLQSFMACDASLFLTICGNRSSLSRWKFLTFRIAFSTIHVLRCIAILNHSCLGMNWNFLFFAQIRADMFGYAQTRQIRADTPDTCRYAQICSDTPDTHRYDRYAQIR